MNELDLTPGKYLAFILITLFFFLAYELYRFYNDSEIIELPDKQEEPASQQLNPNYGAYLWLAGKRYN
ncbi:TPA: hypothetical protein U1X32_001531 [Streptococcus suis]|uniref:hypothetical protein n=1 Tax=Streptococcus suis TaxID=1307 RepID=UPI0015574785|nr:hypothetical protein [Streptococcus suis]NQL71119.1 hypothetical protein [Streptococcus suis]HEM4294062.1 hypothetical protein [Streptococcus suis]